MLGSYPMPVPSFGRQRRRLSSSMSAGREVQARCSHASSNSKCGEHYVAPKLIMFGVWWIFVVFSGLIIVCSISLPDSAQKNASTGTTNVGMSSLLRNSKDIRQKWTIAATMKDVDDEVSQQQGSLNDDWKRRHVEEEAHSTPKLEVTKNNLISVTTDGSSPLKSIDVKEKSLVLGSLSGTAFEDTDNNERDADSLHLLTIVLKDGADDVVATTTLTDSTGSHEFLGLTPPGGIYTVKKKPLLGYDNVSDSAGDNLDPNTVTIGDQDDNEKEEREVTLTGSDLDCRMRVLAFQYAQKIQAWRSPEHHKLVWDALRLTDKNCLTDEAPLTMNENHQIANSATPADGSKMLPPFCAESRCFFVDQAAHTELMDGSFGSPFLLIKDALEASRKTSRGTPSTIILRKGVHFLHQTVKLDERDSSLTLRNFPGEHAMISGGIHVPVELFGQQIDSKRHIQVADLKGLLLNVTSLPKVSSLFTSNARYIRARYPNANPEVDQWGFFSQFKSKYSIAPDETVEWILPPKGEPPEFIFYDFSEHKQHLKNDSTMKGYNTFSSGKGGVCADLWGPDADSYWCSNASAGGWAAVDRECAMEGQLNIPAAVAYNLSHPVGKRLNAWTAGAVGGILHAWHSQTWSMHMFEIESAAPGQFTFAKGGGRQGGRNWCRCDQCTYAGDFCGQHATPPELNDTRLISGNWIVENVLYELDMPGEFYFDPVTKKLFVYVNDTVIPKDMRLALLETLISINGASNVTIHGLDFRDTAPTYMSGNWSAPSGGDWAMHPGGALSMENVSNLTISNNTFSRLDGNGIFLSGKTRNVTIRGNMFEWLGENAIATWGRTKDYDATEMTHPMHTVIEDNIMREIGIYQKQSSGVGQAKASLTTIRNNIMFNMPRAAINFNDMLGGGDVIENNLIFNTCRESGDHGPINTWDRQPFLTTLTGGNTPSFVPLVRTIAYNFIIANYEATDAVDNDDGSSYHHVHHNIFHDSQGFKMDYGGHDSIYEYNLVISHPSVIAQQECITFGFFHQNHGHIVRHNKCIVPKNDKPLAYLDACRDKGTVTIENNKYYSPNATAFYKCGDDDRALWSLPDVQTRYQLERGSTVHKIPRVATIVEWSRKLLSISSTDLRQRMAYFRYSNKS